MAAAVEAGHILQVCTSAFFRIRGTGEFGFILTTGAVALGMTSFAADSIVLQINEWIIKYNYRKFKKNTDKH